MPTQQTRECTNCGRSYNVEEERCPKCGMYKDEDPGEFNELTPPYLEDELINNTKTQESWI